MAYATGIANSAADLRTAVVNLATANGWTWDSANEMLHKTPVFGKLTVSGLKVAIQGALGYSGSTLTSPSGVSTCLRETYTGTGVVALSYPLTYHIFLHTAPDGIVVAVNYGAVWWQWLGLGLGTPTGGGTSTPLWHWGTSEIASSDSGVGLNLEGSGAGTAGGTSGVPFWRAGCGYPVPNSAIYTGGVDGLGTNGWYLTVNTFAGNGGTPGKALANEAAQELLKTQPNTWNGEALLARIHVLLARPSGFRAYCAELPHMRFTRNDNLSDGQIVTIGSDKWFVAPGYRKNTAVRDGTNGPTSHSGTIAVAIRYDGP